MPFPDFLQLPNAHHWNPVALRVVLGSLLSEGLLVGTEWGRTGLKDGLSESGHLGLGRVQSLTQIFSLTGRSAGTTPGPNGAGIDFPAWGWGGCNRKLPSLDAIFSITGHERKHSSLQSPANSVQILGCLIPQPGPEAPLPVQLKLGSHSEKALTPSARRLRESYQVGDQRVLCPVGDAGLPEGRTSDPVGSGQGS